MNITVLCGGTSTERDVSITSGSCVCSALRSKGHRAVLADVFCGVPEENSEDLFPEVYDVEKERDKIRSMTPFVEEELKKPDRPFFGPGVMEICRKSDIVFLALHGENGENGKVQAAFDLWKIRYTGTGHLGSAAAMDKGITKVLLREAFVPTPHGVVLKKDHYLPDIAAYTMKFPVVVKPCNGGSSVGVYIVHDQASYEQALKEAFKLEDEVIVEDYIKGREFSVSIIDGKALPIL